jgi:hypothetical protein
MVKTVLPNGAIMFDDPLTPEERDYLDSKLYATPKTVARAPRSVPAKAPPPKEWQEEPPS